MMYRMSPAGLAEGWAGMEGADRLAQGKASAALLLPSSPDASPGSRDLPPSMRCRKDPSRSCGLKPSSPRPAVMM